MRYRLRLPIRMEFMLAREWNPEKNPAGWFMSEKFDGWRCGWDGEKLVTREGLTLNAPTWFTASLPSVPLDAEIWGGYGSFQELGRILSAPVAHYCDWRRLCLKVIDIHNIKSFFKDALPVISGLSFGPTAQVIEQTLCLSRGHFYSFLGEIMARGGEGVVLRHPYSVYEGCKSSGMRKYKPAQDCEGVVIGYKEGKRSLLLKIKNGIEFYLNAEFAPIGTEITFQHMGFFESGKPREPRFLRIKPSLAA